MQTVKKPVTAVKYYSAEQIRNRTCPEGVYTHSEQRNTGYWLVSACALIHYSTSGRLNSAGTPAFDAKYIRLENAQVILDIFIPGRVVEHEIP